MYTDQWQRVQFRFVDDPHASVTEAADIITQVTTKMEAAIQDGSGPSRNASAP